ncbi:aspartyl protease [Mucilaginibacter frigoritolerans]|uniref:Aspartyl protease n=1 Tax=Mucilaginibacter frigoritolerans TaxID=652788 RepID=A0A562U4J7_9SPHI|nr:aspartyl protease family protein [Mucilaginibacter frigoritolerans]TWJ00743.1 aspartyl protease [Mucilaginibacter frigoritolerans]
MHAKTIHGWVFWLLFLSCFLASSVDAQYFDINGHKKRVIIPFRLVRNMIIIKVEINNKGPFNFIMDTGVGLMIITDPQLIDSLKVCKNRTLKLGGLGEGDDYEAYATAPLQINIPGLTSHDVAAAILKKDNFGLSNYAGMPIHGLLGYEFFNNLAVRVDFSDSTLTVYRPGDVRLYGKGEKIPITIEDHKPYLETNVNMPDGCIKKTKLVIDLGAGHPLLLENMEKALPKNCIAANLGMGFNGPVSGYISRISEVELGKYKIRNIVSSFPTGDSLICKSEDIKRDGNLGLGILKRFIIVFDYHNNLIYLKPGPNFKEPFEHDMSGLEYYAGGDDYKHIIISRVEPGSAGDTIGLEKDDEILSINLKPTSTMSLEQIDDIFKSQNDRNLVLEVFHDNKHDMVIMTLKRRI